MIGVYITWTDGRWQQHDIPADGMSLGLGHRFLDACCDPIDWPLSPEFEDRAALDEAAAEIVSLDPRARINIGPVIADHHGRHLVIGGFCDGHNIFVGCLDELGTLYKLHHEAAHLLRKRLDTPDKMALFAHAGRIRKAWSHHGEWENKIGEAEAEAYATWRYFGPTASPCRGGRSSIAPTDTVIEVWCRMLNRPTTPTPVAVPEPISRSYTPRVLPDPDDPFSDIFADEAVGKI